MKRGATVVSVHVGKRIAFLAVLFAICFSFTTAFGAIGAHAGVGDLGPPPSESEIRQTLTDLYNAGYPPDFTIDVQFDGPIIVGKPTVHANPPPQPWCVRCGYPDQGSSQMYPVVAIVSVTTTQGLVSSALPPSSFVHTTNTSYNGTPCPGETKAEYCPTYFFYRNEQGAWRAT
jgi:hypothetical protein